MELPGPEELKIENSPRRQIFFFCGGRASACDRSEVHTADLVECLILVSLLVVARQPLLAH